MPTMLLLLALSTLPAFHLAHAHPPVTGVHEVVVAGVPGPEGIAFDRGRLYVATAAGEVRRLGLNGENDLVAAIGQPLAGITALRDHRLLTAAFSNDTVWQVDPATGGFSVFASGVNRPNFIVQLRKRGRILVSASEGGTIDDITTGTPVPLATGLTYPNGLAIGRDGYLYVAETFANRISRCPINPDGSLGPPQIFAATDVIVPDGLAFDRDGNLLIAGADTLRIADPSGAVRVLSADPLLNWPANLAFGRGPGFSRRSMFLANYGFPLGSGVDVIEVPYNHKGTPLIR